MLQLLSGKQPTWFISMGANAKDKERVAVIKKDTFNGAHSASLFLSSNTTQFFAQPIPDYSARGDLHNRSFFVYKGTAPVAEVSTFVRNISHVDADNTRSVNADNTRSLHGFVRLRFVH